MILVVVGLISVGMVGFVSNVVVVLVLVVEVAVVRAGSVAAWVDNVGQGGGGVRGLKVERERERELRDCESFEKNNNNNILIQQEE